MNAPTNAGNSYPEESNGRRGHSRNLGPVGLGPTMGQGFGEMRIWTMADCDHHAPLDLEDFSCFAQTVFFSIQKIVFAVATHLPPMVGRSYRKPTGAVVLNWPLLLATMNI